LMLCINITFMNESICWRPLLVKQHLEWVFKDLKVQSLYKHKLQG
jgi:hypothetical protein